MMNRNISNHSGQAVPGKKTLAERLATLHKQRKALGAEIGEMTRASPGLCLAEWRYAQQVSHAS